MFQCFLLLFGRYLFRETRRWVDMYRVILGISALMCAYMQILMVSAILNDHILSPVTVSKLLF